MCGSARGAAHRCGILRIEGQSGPRLNTKIKEQPRCPSPPQRSYAEMITRAKAGGFAYPAINVTSSQTLNAALRGFADAGSDGIVQVSTGGAEYLSGPTDQGHGDRFGGLRRVRRTRSPRSTRSTSRCTPTTARRTSSTGSSGRCWPLSEERVGAGRASRSSSRTCGTARRCRWPRTSQIAEELLALCAAAKVILEIEVGVVGGEEDGVVGAIDEKLYTHRRGRPGHWPPRSAWARRASTWPP